MERPAKRMRTEAAAAPKTGGRLGSAGSLFEAIEQYPPVFEALCRHVRVEDWHNVLQALGRPKIPDFPLSCNSDKMAVKKRNLLRQGKFMVKVKSLREEGGEEWDMCLESQVDCVAGQGCSVPLSKDKLFIQEQNGFSEVLQLSSYIGDLAEFKAFKVRLTQDYYIIDGVADRRKVTVLVGREGRGEQRKILYMRAGQLYLYKKNQEEQNNSVPVHLNSKVLSLLTRTRVDDFGCPCSSCIVENTVYKTSRNGKSINYRSLLWEIKHDLMFNRHNGKHSLSCQAFAVITDGAGGEKLRVIHEAKGIDKSLELPPKDEVSVQRDQWKILFVSNDGAIVALEYCYENKDKEAHIVNTRTGDSLLKTKRFRYFCKLSMLETPPQGSGPDSFYWLVLTIFTPFVADRLMPDPLDRLERNTRKFHFFRFATDGSGEPTKVATGAADNDGKMYTDPIALHCVREDILALELRNEREDNKSFLACAELREEKDQQARYSKNSRE